ncbi:uncharacterized protein LOC131236817 [Magnolia sinica]|uniref:uncharacterized protein LOC131236817 n=1 Tax=Magnolia sinica TaxID=86752 RepID=UPI00265A79B3|nr:uncharacterized protein LOC131236817 [Magnolia sinica]
MLLLPKKMMADHSRLHTAIWTVKLAFFSIGIISTVVLLKHSIPYSLDLFISTLPRVWIFFHSWLSPPYLYILMNVIIITIAASSKFHQKLSEKKNESKEEKSQRKQRNSEDSSQQKTAQVIWPDITASDKNPSDPDEKPSESWSDIFCVTDSVEKSVKPSSENVRKSVRRSASSKSLGVSKPKKNDTLDATWKAITEDRGKPLARQLRKSETWEVAPRVEAEPEPPALVAQRDLRKSETFNDTASSAWRGGLRRELSLSKEELNRRVEAFIKKFNNEIRLQRQESYQKFMELVNRGL